MAGNDVISVTAGNLCPNRPCSQTDIDFYNDSTVPNSPIKSYRTYLTNQMTLEVAWRFHNVVRTKVGRCKNQNNNDSLQPAFFMFLLSTPACLLKLHLMYDKVLMFWWIRVLCDYAEEIIRRCFSFLYMHSPAGSLRLLCRLTHVENIYQSKLLQNSDICPLLKRLLNSLMTDQMVKIAPLTSNITTPSPRCLSVASSQPSHSSPDVQGAHGEGFFH